MDISPSESAAKLVIENHWIEQFDTPKNSLEEDAARAMAREHVDSLRIMAKPSTHRHVSAMNMDGIAGRHDNYRDEIARLDPQIAAEVTDAGARFRADREREYDAGAAHVAALGATKATPAPDIKWTNIPATPGLSERMREGWVSISPEDALFLEASKGIHASIREDRLKKEAAIEAMPGAQAGLWGAEQFATINPITARQSLPAPAAERSADIQQGINAGAKAAEVVSLVEVGSVTAEQKLELARALQAVANSHANGRTKWAARNASGRTPEQAAVATAPTLKPFDAANARWTNVGSQTQARTQEQVAADFAALSPSHPLPKDAQQAKVVEPKRQERAKPEKSEEVKAKPKKPVDEPNPYTKGRTKTSTARKVGKIATHMLMGLSGGYAVNKLYDAITKKKPAVEKKPSGSSRAMRR